MESRLIESSKRVDRLKNHNHLQLMRTPTSSPSPSEAKAMKSQPKVSPSSKRSWMPRKRRSLRQTKLAQVDHLQTSRTFKSPVSLERERLTGDTTPIWSTSQVMRPICSFRLLTRWTSDGRPIRASIRSIIPTTDPTAIRKSSSWLRPAVSQSAKCSLEKVPISNNLSNWLKSIKKHMEMPTRSQTPSCPRTSTGVTSVATTS